MHKLFVIALLFAQSALAHEGHDHGPSAVQPPKGGILRSLETVHLELVAKGKMLKVYAYDMNLQPVEVSGLPMTASVTLPRGKAQALPLAAKGKYWEAQFDAKGAHRYTVELAIRQGGHDDKVKYTVEPKK